MAWTPVGATPGTLLSVGIDLTRRDLFSVSVSPVSGVSFDILKNPIYGIPFVSGDPSGELAYETGGGSTRPASGFLYPRGN